MKALVVVPTYDERENIDEVVARTMALPPWIDLLIVDDSSPDGTGARAEELAADEPRVRVVHRAAKEGLGPAYRHGFGVGLADGYDVLVEMDADLSHDPAVVPALIAGTQRADLVIGSRYVPGGGVANWPWHRRLLSAGGNLYVRVLTGAPARDATSGFRAFRRELLEAIDVTELHSDGYSFQLETVLHTWLGGFTIAEVPITFVERVHGASKISRSIVFEAMARVVVWGLRCLRPRLAGIQRDPRSVAVGRRA